MLFRSRNPATGDLEAVHGTPGFFEQAVRTLPYVSSIRSAVQGDRRVYDTVSTARLIATAFGAGSWKDISPGRQVGQKRILGVSAATALLGVPVVRVNRGEELSAILKREIRYAAAVASQARTVARRSP